MDIKKIKEAIEDLKYAKTSVSFFGQEESLDLAIKTLEKEIPKKISYEGFCQNCKQQYPMYPPSLEKYCSNCGQRLDW